jgi:hypothetical protein
MHASDIAATSRREPERRWPLRPFRDSPRFASGYVSGYLGPFSPRYRDAPDSGANTLGGRPHLKRVPTVVEQHTPGGPPVDEPPPFPKPPAPEQDPPKEPVAPPVI